MAIPDLVRRMVRASADYLLKTVVLLIVLNIGLGVCFYFSDAYRARHPGPNAIVRKYPHVGATLLALYPSMTKDEVGLLLWETWSVRKMEPQLFTGYGESPYQGKFLNVSKYGFRVGANQGAWLPVHEGNFVVFLFGGSTTFGYGVTDDQALGSQLQPLLAKKLGRPVTVYNFGQGGYYSTQERLLFEKLIMAGQRPDLAIFVDGLNDFESDGADLLIPSTLPLGQPESTWSSWLREGIQLLPMMRLVSSMRRNLQSSGFMKAPATGPTLARKYDAQGPLLNVIDRYFLNKQWIEEEAKGLSIPTLFVWQPVPTYEYDLKYDPFGAKGIFGEEGFKEHDYAAYGYPLMWAAVSRTRPSNFLWCADIQKDVHESLYVDSIHYSPKMTEMVADCIVDGVK